MTTAPPRIRAVLLALLDALIAGMGLGYLADRYREVLVANSAAIGLGLVLVFAAAWLLRMAARTLLRASARIDAIFADEREDKPPPSPRPR
jgi:protein-S-isoprenylcysteine O-methyltransferase Ste14